MPWLVRHVEFLQNRYGVRSATGLTPFETVNNRPYRGELMPWLSPVMVRVPGTEDRPAHLGARWLSGLYLGRRADSDEHLVITADA
eukprot:3889675-Heterocapsa_arctica.AAC.1